MPRIALLAAIVVYDCSSLSWAVSLESTPPLMRRDSSLQSSRADFENGTAMSLAEGASAFVYDSLVAQNARPQNLTPTAPPTLQNFCLLTNELADTTPFLPSRTIRTRVKDGIELAKKRRLIIGGLWRQIGFSSVKQIWDSLTHLGSFFHDFQLIMLENDSEDDTAAAIRQLCSQEARAWCFTLKGISKYPQHQDTPFRVKHLTALRQHVLSKAREFDTDGIFDYMMFVDADIFSDGAAGFDTGGALAAFGMTSSNGLSADAVCAFQLQGRTANYADTFAHRGPACVYKDLDEEEACPAQSCGGGMVIYTMAALRESRCDYFYVNEDTCEHVPFNACLAQHNHSRIFLYKAWGVANRFEDDVSDWHCSQL